MKLFTFSARPIKYLLLLITVELTMFFFLSSALKPLAVNLIIGLLNIILIGIILYRIIVEKPSRNLFKESMKSRRKRFIYFYLVYLACTLFIPILFSLFIGETNYPGWMVPLFIIIFADYGVGGKNSAIRIRE